MLRTPTRGLILGLSLGLVPLHAEPATHGEPIPTYFVEEGTDLKVQNFQNLHRPGRSSAEIEDILDLEGRARTVEDAIRIKESGLGLVRSLADFEHLTRSPFSTPSGSYKTARTRFIEEHVDRFVESVEDLDLLQVLEGRCSTVEGTMLVKEAGLAVVRNLQDFEELTRSPFDPGSKFYLQERSRFIARYVDRVARADDSIETLLVLEGRLREVGHCIEVKEVGLRLVHSIEDYRDLVRSAFDNATSNYNRSRIAFLVANIHRCVDSGSDIDVILHLESMCWSVEQCMEVKTVGLKACSDINDFLTLTRPAFSTPTALYRTSLSRFISRYSSRFAN